MEGFSLDKALGGDTAGVSAASSASFVPALSFGDEKAAEPAVFTVPASDPNPNPQIDLTGSAFDEKAGAGAAAPALSAAGGMDVESASLQHFANTYQRLLDTLEDAPAACEPDIMVRRFKRATCAVS